MMELWSDSNLEELMRVELPMNHLLCPNAAFWEKCCFFMWKRVCLLRWLLAKSILPGSSAEKGRIRWKLSGFSLFQWKSSVSPLNKGVLGAFNCSGLFLLCCLFILGAGISRTRVSLACIVSVFAFPALRLISLHSPVLPLPVNEPSPSYHYHTLLQGFSERVQEANLHWGWLVLYHVFWKLLKEGNEMKLWGKKKRNFYD